MNKVIQISPHKKTGNKISEGTIVGTTKKINNEKIKNEKKSYIDLVSKVNSKEVTKDLSNAIISIYDNYDIQLELIQKLYKGIPFYEQK